MIKLLMCLYLLGHPDYQVRKEYTTRMEMCVDIGMTYKELKYLNTVTDDPEVKMRLKRIAAIAWEWENQAKYSGQERLSHLDFKEDW